MTTELRESLQLLQKGKGMRATEPISSEPENAIEALQKLYGAPPDYTGFGYCSACEEHRFLPAGQHGRTVSRCYLCGTKIAAEERRQREELKRRYDFVIPRNVLSIVAKRFPVCPVKLFSEHRKMLIEEIDTLLKMRQLPLTSIATYFCKREFRRLAALNYRPPYYNRFASCKRCGVIPVTKEREGKVLEKCEWCGVMA